MTQIYQFSASQLQKAIQTKQVSVLECVRAHFQQIEQHNPTLNAFITLCQDQAEQEAMQLDAAIAQGMAARPLQGIPFSAKDLTPTAGVRTTYGSLIYKDHVPTQDELCIQRLRKAGAILVGKTNTPEFGMGAHTTNALYGPTANPYDPTRTSGGSSGGAAVSVATGMCAIAQGTDMGGSVRTPASFCGVVGLRPSMGRIPRAHKPLLWDYLDTDGILARTVEDAALMLSVMAGYDARDPLSIPQLWAMPDFSSHSCDQLVGHLRVGFSSNLGVASIDAAVEEVFRKAISQMAPLCQDVAETHPDCTQAQSAFEVMRAATLAYKQRHHYANHREVLSETVRWNIEQGCDISAAELLEAEAKRDRLYQNFLRFFQHYDVLATVSASVLPFPHTQPNVLEINATPLRNMIDYLTITYIISLTGLPAISIPCGWSNSGLPIGMQLIGKPQGEGELLQFAYLLQERLNFRHRWAP